MEVSTPLPKADVARLLMQTLADYGFSNAAQALEVESGVHLESPAAKQLSAAVLAGEWQSVLTLLVPPSPVALPDEAQALVLRQVFLEEALASPLAALGTLRTRLAPLVPSADLHALAALLALPDGPALMREAKWSAPPQSRQALLTRLRCMLPPGDILPPRRLHALAEQAWQWQRQACANHLSAGGAQQGFSLLADHACKPLRLPRAPHLALEAHTDEVWCVAFARAGHTLATGARNGQLALWALRDTAPEARMLTGHTQAVSALAWAPGDALLASGSLDGSVRVWGTEQGACQALLEAHTEGVVAVAWLPDGRHLVSTAHDKLLLLWDTHTQRVVVRHALRARLNDLAVSAAGDILVAVCQEKRIRVMPMPAAPYGPSSAWPAEAEQQTLQESEAITSLALSQDGKYALVCTAGAAPAVHLWHLERRALLHKYLGHKQGRFVVRACFAGVDESLVLSGSEDSLVYVWHRAQASLLATLPAHSGTVNAVASCNGAKPGELLFASASDDRSVLIWKAQVLG